MKKTKRLKTFIFIATLAIFSTVFFVEPVSAAHWSEGHYVYLKNMGVLNSDFGTVPEAERNRGITRGEFFSLMISALHGKQMPISTLPHFADFDKAPANLSGYLAKAHEADILTGIQRNGNYYIDSQRPISRQEAAVVLGRALNLSINLPSGFTDETQIAGYAKDFVTGCERSGVMNGYASGAFLPKGDITWAESVKVISSAMQNRLVELAEVSAVAGNGGRGSGNGEALVSAFSNPTALAIENGSLYVTDSGNNKIRKLYAGEVSDFAGKTVGRDLYDAAINGYKDGALKDALFAYPTDIALVKQGILVADSQNNNLRLIDGKTVYTLAGSEKSGHKDGANDEALFNNPKGLCTDDEGNIYVADTDNHVIRKIDTEGNVATLAGSVGQAGYKDGNSKAALFNAPSKLAFSKGILYVSDSANNRVRMIKDGTVTTLTGSGTDTYEGNIELVGDYRDGSINVAAFNNPTGICVADDGTVYVADTGNSRVRRIKDGNVSTLAKGFENPIGLCLDKDRLYVADSFKNTIYVIML